MNGSCYYFCCRMLFYLFILGKKISSGDIFLFDLILKKIPMLRIILEKKEFYLLIVDYFLLSHYVFKL